MQHSKLFRGLQGLSAHSLDPVASTRPRDSAQRTAAVQSCQGVFTGGTLLHWVDKLDCCPWGATSGRPVAERRRPSVVRPLYAPDERKRRDETPWTMVQAILAPVQFMVFLISLGLVLRYLATGDGYAAATGSIILKTFVLYAIMITGSIWERVVFGRYLFAPAFYWEDMFSILVLALHTLYLAVMLTDAVDTRHQMLIALAAYASYAVNAAQFVFKLRAARREMEIGDFAPPPGRPA